MPVILTDPEEIEAWLSAPMAEALKLQRPLPDGALRIVARGARQDGPSSAGAPFSKDRLATRDEAELPGISGNENEPHDGSLA